MSPESGFRGVAKAGGKQLGSWLTNLWMGSALHGVGGCVSACCEKIGEPLDDTYLWLLWT